MRYRPVLQLLPPSDIRLDVLPAGAHVVVLDAPDRLLAGLTDVFRGKEAKLTLMHLGKENAGNCEHSLAIDPGLEGEMLDAEIKSVLKTAAAAGNGVDIFLSFSEVPLVNFLFAKHLSRWYRHSTHPARKVFMVITHLDGQLGLSGLGHWQPQTGALFGLAKTLSQEWEQVFCRAVDMAPGMEAETEMAVLFSEMQAVDQQPAEVGWTNDNRWTIGLEILDEGR